MKEPPMPEREDGKLAGMTNDLFIKRYRGYSNRHAVGHAFDRDLDALLQSERAKVWKEAETIALEAFDKGQYASSEAVDIGNDIGAQIRARAREEKGQPNRGVA